MSTGLLVSSFDLFNVADLDLIAQARSICGRLVVGVLSDDDVISATGWAPVVPEAGRLALLRHVRDVDEVIVADSRDDRWGAGADTLVMTSDVADLLRSGDLLLLAGRRTSSDLLNRLIAVGAPQLSEGVA